MIGKATTKRFAWGDGCEGWTYIDAPELHVVLERMPPRTEEVPHVHSQTRQLYYVLGGEAKVVVGAVIERLGVGQGLEIPPTTPHQIRNDSADPLEFLVVSSGPPQADRRDLV